MAMLRHLQEQVFEHYPQLKRVRSYVTAQYMEPISLQQVAAIAGMETKYFSRFFRSKVGVPFGRWRTQVRIAEAVAIMRREDRLVTKIAFDVGLQDITTFERAFKRVIGQSPRQFKQQLRSA